MSRNGFQLDPARLTAEITGLRVALGQASVAMKALWPGVVRGGNKGEIKLLRDAIVSAAVAIRPDESPIIPEAPDPSRPSI